MSEIFEGIICPTQAATFAEMDGRDRGLELETEELGEGIAAVYRSDSRQEAGFSSRMDELAAEVSKRCGKALLARFDSRAGSRSSAMFENGQRGQAFGEDDELYVPLDDKGDPVRNASPVRLTMLDPDQEYETIQNAIQLGLRAFGRDTWTQLFRVITAS